MKKVIRLLMLLSVAAFSSCETDVDVLAPYRETPVVYGLLNAADSTQYIRINRAFLGEGNAYTMAQQPDSFNYRDILDVSLQRWKNSLLVSTVSLIRDSSINLEPGIFAQSPNILYKTPLNYLLDNESEYKLFVHNRETNTDVTSSTELVGDITITGVLNFGTLTFANPDPYVIEWYQGKNGKVYNFTLHFEYDETDNLDPNYYARKSVDWVLPNVVATEVNQTAKLKLSIEGESFYNHLRGSIPVDPHKIRGVKSIRFIITIGADAFYTYALVNRPPTGLVQNIPDYTNITGGRGIFSSRFIRLKPCNLDGASTDSLFHGSITSSLNFTH